MLRPQPGVSCARIPSTAESITVAFIQGVLSKWFIVVPPLHWSSCLL
jgi:hypothetical protein